MTESKLRWDANVKGAAGEPAFEISVVRSDNAHGKLSYGWFDERKLLISHNGGPCVGARRLVNDQAELRP